MTDLVNDLAVSQRSRTAESIWKEVRDLVRAKYVNVHIHTMKKKEVVSLVGNQRQGGHRADRISDIEIPSSLSENGMHPYLCFNTLVYDLTSSTPAQHRVTG